MTEPLNVWVLRDRYQTTFMTPRTSRHTIRRKRFVPFNKLKSQYDGFTLLSPGLGADFVHAHNRVPLGARKSIVSFESHLPRHFGISEANSLYRLMREHIRSNSCRRIIGMSHFAARLFRQQHEGKPWEDEVTAKLMVRHPNLEVTDTVDIFDPEVDTRPLKLVFIGGHFARKGGCVALRIAEIAQERNLPIEVTIISSLVMGEEVWTDPTVEGFFDEDTARLDLPNVNMLGAQPNSVVRDVLANSHFSLLTTFADTFGFSALESMAEHTPVIASPTGALPEFVTDGENGIIVPVETTDVGEWAGLDYHARGTEAYAQRFRADADAMAEATVERLEPFLNDRHSMVPMRRMARQTIEDMFDSRRRSPEWDALYDRIAKESPNAPIELDPEHDWSSPSAWHAPKA